MNRKQFILSIFLVLFMGLTLSGAPHAQAQFFLTDDNELIGKPAPEFTLTTTQGDKQSLTQVRNGKKSIVFFWATWCPVCREEIKDLKKAYQDIEHKDVKIILVDLGESENKVKNFLQKNKLNFSVLLDKKDDLSETYSLIGIPTLVFLDEKGIVLDVEHGLPDDWENIFKKDTKKK